MLFKSFSANTIGEYTFSVKCFISKDQLRENDTLTSRFSVVTGNDLQLIEILEPNGAIKTGTVAAPPKIVIRNNGLIAATNALITLDIGSNSNPNYYLDTLYANIGSFSIDTFTLGKSLSFDEIGDYYITAINRRGGEDFRNNLDTIKSTYIVRYGSDLGITSHLFPVNIDTLEHNEIIAPRVQIVNYGLDTLVDIKVLVNIKNLANEIIYIDTLKLAELAPNRANNFTSTKQWIAKSGFYTMSSTLLNTDDLADNNVFSSTFIVRKQLDILIDSILTPTSNSDLIVNRKYKPEVRVRNDGYENADNIVVSCEVRENASLLYIKSKIIALSAYTDTIIAFDSSLTSNDARTNVTARFVVSKLGDLIRDNDTLITTFNFIKGVSISELASKSVIQVYPNPFGAHFIVKSESPINQVKVFDVNGKLVFSQTANQEKEIKVVMELAAGSYVLEVNTSEGIQRLNIVKKE